MNKCEHQRTGKTYAERDKGQPLYHKEVIICLDCGEILGDANEELEFDKKLKFYESRREGQLKSYYKKNNK